MPWNLFSPKPEPSSSYGITIGPLLCPQACQPPFPLPHSQPTSESAWLSPPQHLGLCPLPLVLGLPPPSHHPPALDGVSPSSNSFTPLIGFRHLCLLQRILPSAAVPTSILHSPGNHILVFQAPRIKSQHPSEAGPWDLAPTCHSVP